MAGHWPDPAVGAQDTNPRHLEQAFLHRNVAAFLVDSVLILRMKDCLIDATQGVCVLFRFFRLTSMRFLSVTS